MKLTSVRVEHVLRITDIGINPKHAVMLFCGDNDVGKSSLQEALRLAFLGESVRVPLKKDYDMLVNEGAKAGAIVVEFSHEGEAGRAAIKLPSGKQECHPKAPPALEYVLDPNRFWSLPPKDRRKFLYDLVGVRTNPEAVKKRMLDRGGRKNLIEVISPILKTGFESAEKYCNERLTEFRANWKSITGENYGVDKALVWSAPLSGHDVNREEIAKLEEAIKEVKAERDDLNKSLGAAESYLSTKDRFDRESASLKERSDKLGDRRKAETAADKAAKKNRTDLSVAQGKLQDARKEAQPCPECGAMLGHNESGKLIAVQVVKKKDLANLEAEVQELEAAQKTLDATLAKCTADVQDSLNATEALAALQNAVSTQSTPAKVEDLRASIAELDAEIKTSEQKKIALESIVEEMASAKKKTEDAKRINEEVMEWQKIKEMVASDGIPMEILNEALGPFNARLADTAKRTGWPQVAVRGDMEVTIGGRYYGLCGESVRWRADAALAEAVSFTAGLRLLVLDRIDVLQPSSRGVLLDWMDALVSEDKYESILLFGTLKSKPEIDGVDVYWIQGGHL